MSNTTFETFPKIARLSRECVITEKLDGTNAQIFIWEDTPGNTEAQRTPWLHRTEAGLYITAGSRNRWITPENDNYGFAKWVQSNAAELVKLGPGRHFGEWWGQGIQRGYGLTEKRFSLFNVHRWFDRLNTTPMGPTSELCPECCLVVPMLYQGPFNTLTIELILDGLRDKGSSAAPGYMNPEGIVIYHTASKTLFKKTIIGDESPKGAQ